MTPTEPPTVEEERVTTLGEPLEQYITSTTGNESISEVTEQIRVWYTADDLCDLDILEVPMLVEDFLPRTGRVAIVGESDTGKSKLARQLALSIGAGHSHFLGKQMNLKYSRALYVTTEDGLDFTAPNVKRQCAATGRAKTDFLLADDLSADEILKQVTERVKSNPVDLIVIDAWGDASDLRDGNSPSDVRTALKKYAALASNCLVLFVHHVNKMGEGASPSKRFVEGGGSFEKKCRGILYLSQDGKPSWYLSWAKANYLPPQLKEQAMVLSFNATNFTFSDTYKPVLKLSLGAQAKSEERIEWSKVPKIENGVNRTQAAKHLLERYGIPRSSAFKKIDSALRNGEILEPSEELAKLFLPLSQSQISIGSEIETTATESEEQDPRHFEKPKITEPELHSFLHPGESLTAAELHNRSGLSMQAFEQKERREAKFGLLKRAGRGAALRYSLPAPEKSEAIEELTSEPNEEIAPQQQVGEQTEQI
jgi:hypothetical protein